MFENNILSVSIPETFEAWVSLLVSMLANCDIKAIIQRVTMCDFVALVPDEGELRDIVENAIKRHDYLGRSLASLKEDIYKDIECWAKYKYGYQHSVQVVVDESGVQILLDGSLSDANSSKGETLTFSVLARSQREACAAVVNELDTWSLLENYRSRSSAGSHSSAENDDTITEDDGDLVV